MTTAKYRTIRCSEDVASILDGEANEYHERLWVLLMDTRNQVRERHMVYQGNVDGIKIRPAEILRYGVIAGTPNMIIAHNHPSGDPSPSPEDVNMTRTLSDGAKLLGIDLLDHVIVTRDGNHVSLRDRGVMEKAA